jgi:hypothetical protein
VVAFLVCYLQLQAEPAGAVRRCAVVGLGLVGGGGDLANRLVRTAGGGLGDGSVELL